MDALTQKYHVQVVFDRDHQVTEWSGILTLSTQANGEMSIDISFDDRSIELI